MVGILKSLGATNKMIRKIFIVSGTQLLTKGLFWGNSIGLGLALMQYYFKIIPLDAANYYMPHVPIEIDVMTVLGLNVLVLVLIGMTLLIPSGFVARIRPIKAIRFD